MPRLARHNTRQARHHPDADQFSARLLSVIKCRIGGSPVESVVESARRFLGAIGAFRALACAVRAGRWARAAGRAYGKEKVYGSIP